MRAPPIARGRAASRCRRQGRPARPTTTSTPGSSASRRSWLPACGSGSISPRPSCRNGYAGEIAVPLWAGFMKVATKDDKPEWLARPANVIGTNVCRISGKLPAGGCDHVEVVNRDGLLEKRSMIYTEYFVKGTQPTEQCPLHEDRGFLDALAGVFGKDSGPPPMPVDATGLPVPPTPPNTARAPRARPPSPVLRKPSRPRRSAASGRASSAAAATRRTRTERRTSRRKSPAGDSDSPARHALSTSRRAPRPPRSRCARGCPRFPAAQPHLRGARRSRETARCALAGAVVQLHERGRRGGRRARARRVRQLQRLPPHRARRARRRARHRAGGHRFDQGGSGACGHRAHGLPAVRGPASRGDRRRRGCHGGGAAERAAEDARGAAGGVDLRAGDVAPGRAAADGAVALPAHSVRADLARGDGVGADARARFEEREAHAAATAAEGSIGRALEGDSEPTSGRATPPKRC